MVNRALMICSPIMLKGGLVRMQKDFVENGFPVNKIKRDIESKISVLKNKWFCDPTDAQFILNCYG